MAKILPFDRRRVETLIGKVDIDRKIRTNFLKEVRKTLFKTHGKFLSNPLLCTMMLMTYNEFEEIPGKIHIFYARAFDVLLTRHDKTKTFFNRKFYTSVAEDDFKRLFSAFCFISYGRNAFSFEREQILPMIASAIELEKIDARSEEFLADLHESVSILVRDGDVYSFLHRSFQEYFVARFLAERDLPKIGIFFRRMLEDHRSDSVARLLYEINRDAFEIRYFMPLLRDFRKKISKINVDDNPSKALALVYRRVMTAGGLVQGLEFTANYGVLATLSSLYQCKGASGLMKMFPHKEWQGLVVGYLRSHKITDDRDLLVTSLPAKLFMGSPLHADLVALTKLLIWTRSLRKDGWNAMNSSRLCWSNESEVQSQENRG